MAVSGTPVTGNAIKKTCYQAIESKTPSTIDWSTVVGQGTYGIILGTVVEPHRWVVKVANCKGSCETMDHEFMLHQAALRALAEVQQRMGHLPIFCPDLTNFFQNDTCCWYYMSKIYKTEKKLVHCTIFATEDDHTREAWSGIFPIPVDLERYIQQYCSEGKMEESITDLSRIAYLNGIIFGTLHYGSKQTGNDLEIVLGKDSANGKISVYFYDFDKSQWIPEWDESMIKPICQSMQGAYCQFLGDRGERFKEGYRLIAEQYGQLSYANRIIASCEEFESMLMEGGRQKKMRRRRTIRHKKNRRRSTRRRH